MTDFIQLHVLASYPPSNLNRDDLGRPKTAVMGGTQRLRISSQSLKRAWRQSDFLQEALSGHIGIRTKEMGTKIVAALTTGKTLTDILKNPEKAPSRAPVPEKKAVEWAKAIAGQFGKLPERKDKNPEKVEQAEEKSPVKIEQIAHFSPEEVAAIDALLGKCVTSGKAPDKDDLLLLRKEHTAADIAMFGRMFANSPAYNTEAAVQVSHAITVHDVVVEDDYFTAVDDLNALETDAGSAHIGQFEFAAGLYYFYICINRDLLVENLIGDADLASRAIAAITEACAKVAPAGKQASFASRAYASYMLAERGSQQPRSLAVAYVKAVKGGDILGTAIGELEETRKKIDKIYGPCCEDARSFNTTKGEGSLAEIIRFVSS